MPGDSKETLTIAHWFIFHKPPARIKIPGLQVTKSKPAQKSQNWYNSNEEQQEGAALLEAVNQSFLTAFDGNQKSHTTVTHPLDEC